MGTQERRARERAQLRARIVDVARELFIRHGVASVTMRAIAERMEYTPAALYRHYRDKQALIDAVIEADHQSLAGELRQAAAEVNDPIERIRRIGRAYAEFGSANPELYRLMFMSTPESGAAARVPAPRGATGARDDCVLLLRRTVAEAVAARRIRPELTDVDILAQALWAALHGVVALHVVREHHPAVSWRPARQTALLAIDAVLRGVTRPGARM